MGRGGAPERRPVVAALIALAAIALPVALLTYAGVFTSSSPGGGSQIATPPVLTQPTTPNQGTPTGSSVQVVRHGVPLGPPKLPEELYGEVFTGTKLTVTPE